MTFPKLMPSIVMVLPPDVGAFGLTALETSGASYVKVFALVPTTAETVIVANRFVSYCE